MVPSSLGSWHLLSFSCTFSVPGLHPFRTSDHPSMQSLLSPQFPWVSGKIQETPSEFLSPMIERIKTRRTLGKKLGQPHETMLHDFVTLRLWQGLGGDHTVQRAIYLMMDRKKGETMEGDRPKTKEVLQEHAPSDWLSQLGPISQEINSVTRPEACSMAPHLNFATLGTKHSNIDPPRTFHI